MRDILTFETEFSFANLLYVLYYIGVHGLAIHYFLTAGANPGFVALHDEPEDSEISPKIQAMARVQH